MFKTSLVQFDTIYKDPEANREKIKKAVELAVKEQPDLIVFPETCTAGYSTEIFHEIEKYAEESTGKTLFLFKELAKQYHVCLCTGSMPEKDKKKIYNTVFFIDRDGEVVEKYRKIHLYSDMDEDKAFEHGTEMPVFHTEFGKIAMMTCYDIRFVELSRTYAVRGAQAIIVVSNFPNPKVNHWRTLLQARAIENQLYIIACNRVGTAGESSYFGHSLIIDPWGEIVEEGDDAERIITGVVDFSRVEEVRKTIPMYFDRRPESYPYDILRKGPVCGN